MDHRFNLNKYINAVLFFSSKELIGITKLNKLLYYSDFEHFRQYGRPIIGDEYIKLDLGPVPERSYSIFNSNFREDVDSSLKKYFTVKPTLFGNFTEKTIRPLQESNLDYFSESEIQIMTKVLQEYTGKTATFMSQKTHDERPWKDTSPYEIINYKLILDKSKESISQEFADYIEAKDKEMQFILH